MIRQIGTRKGIIQVDAETKSRYTNEYYMIDKTVIEQNVCTLEMFMCDVRQVEVSRSVLTIIG